MAAGRPSPQCESVLHASTDRVAYGSGYIPQAALIVFRLVPAGSGTDACASWRRPVWPNEEIEFL